MVKQNGFSMIEVLVALVVLLVGLLGVAGLQTTSLRTTADSGNRGQMIRLAYDMSDRLRADPAQLATYITTAASSQSSESSSTCYDAKAGCTGATRVTAQTAEWQRMLASIPGGEGIVCRDSSPNDGTGRASPACTGNAADPLVVKVWWNARAIQGGNATGTQQMLFTTQVGL